MREQKLNNKQKHAAESDLSKLAAPAQRALAGAGIQHLAQLTRFTAHEIKQLHGIGPRALNELRRALMTKGLTFAGEKNSRAAR